jgi:hypothetical protein
MTSVRVDALQLGASLHGKAATLGEILSYGVSTRDAGIRLVVMPEVLESDLNREGFLTDAQAGQRFVQSSRERTAR